MQTGKKTGIKRLALVGAGGMLAYMARRVLSEGHEVSAFDLPDFDITKRENVLSALRAARPDIILNCAAYTNVDGAESDAETAMKVNGQGPAHLAEAARELGAVLVHISTDYIFDGSKGLPYTEEDKPNPLSVYGSTKLEGELSVVRSRWEKYLIVRTSWLYGPHGKNFVETIIRLATEREELRIVDDQCGCPTYTEDLSRAIAHLLDREAFGVFHFSNEASCSWHEFALEIIRQCEEKGLKMKVKRVLPIKTSEYPLPARRPEYSVLSTLKYARLSGAAIPHWKDGLRRYLAQRTER